MVLLHLDTCIPMPGPSSDSASLVSVPPGNACVCVCVVCQCLEMQWEWGVHQEGEWAGQVCRLHAHVACTQRWLWTAAQRLIHGCLQRLFSASTGRCLLTAPSPPLPCQSECSIQHCPRQQHSSALWGLTDPGLLCLLGCGWMWVYLLSQAVLGFGFCKLARRPAAVGVSTVWQKRGSKHA